MKNLSIAVLATLSLATVACGKKGGDTASLTADMDKFAADMCACKDMACSKGVSDAMAKWATDKGAKSGAANVSDPEAAKIAEAGKKLGDCSAKLMTAAAAVPAVGSDATMAPPPAAGSDTMAGSGSAGSAAGSAAMAGSAAPVAEIPQECKDYQTGVDKFAACTAVPQAQRDAVKTGFDSVAKGWTSGALDDTKKASVAQACKDGLVTLKQTAQGQGCTI